MYFSTILDLLLYLLFILGNITLLFFVINYKKRWINKKMRIIPTEERQETSYKHNHSFDKIFITTSLLFLIPAFYALKYNAVYMFVTIIILSLVSFFNWIEFDALSLRNKIDSIHNILLGIVVYICIIVYKLSLTCLYLDTIILFEYLHSTVLARIYKNNYWVIPHLLMHVTAIALAFVFIEDMKNHDPINDIKNLFQIRGFNFHEL